MIVSFETSALRALCASLDAAERELGADDARSLNTILSDIEALDTANEFLELAMDDARVLSSNAIEVAVGREHRAILVPVGVRYRIQPDGSPDWSTVRYLKLTALPPRR
ncbi:hypothetical protein [Methylobacterium soli]|uniref:Uncharacterized protein n=1 Tax=Methylobacterium soli TaxID=553447 RepID=A0A6L3T002_9HYPH|nr:hypothetical protein [Methylobacterium soli]KAB1076435.1 hypothetical protein F6X53_23200 [Methylobacterium soli]GJE42866.1 hypothetical protein AEGHOMDF_2040 [Methylobacterium soli]